MSIAFVASAYASVSGSAATIDASPTLTLQAGDLLVGLVGYSGNTASGATLAQTDGVNPCDAFPDSGTWYSGNQIVFFKESCVAASGVTFRATLNAADTDRSITILQFRPDAGDEITLHGNVYDFFNEYTGVAALSVGPFSTMGDDVVVINLARKYQNNAMSARQIGGVSADGYVTNGLIEAWYKTRTADASGIYATATLAADTDVGNRLLTFRATPKGTAISTVRLHTASSDYLSLASAPSGGTLISCWGIPPAITGDYPHSRGNFTLVDLLGAALQVSGLTANLEIATEHVNGGKYNANSMAYAIDGGGTGYINDYTPFSVGGAIPERDALGPQFYVIQVVVGGSSVTLRQWTKPGRGAAIRYNATTKTFTQLRADLVANAGWTTTRANAWSPSDISSILIGDILNGDNPYYGDMTRVRVYGMSTEPTLAWIDTLSFKDDADTAAWADWPLEWVSGAAVLTDRSGNGRNLTLHSGGTLYQGSSFNSGATASGIVGAGGIASGEAIGGPSLSASISSTAIASAGAFGAPSISSSISPAGISSAQAIGSPSVSAGIAPSGIVSAEVLGVPSLAASIIAAAIASSEAAGSPAISATLALTGIPSSEVLGLPIVGAASDIIGAGGIVSAEGFGVPALFATISGGSIISSETIGAPIISASVSASSIPSSEDLGSPSLSAALAIAGIISLETFGLPSISLSISSSGISSLETFGLPTIGTPTGIIGVGGISSGEIIGAANIQARLFLVGIIPEESFGLPIVHSFGIYGVGGILSEEAGGNPSLSSVLAMAGIASLEAFGLPSIGGTHYNPGDELTIVATTKLYAQWEAVP
jgi:hypothetical protein